MTTHCREAMNSHVNVDRAQHEDPAACSALFCAVGLKTGAPAAGEPDGSTESAPPTTKHRPVRRDR
ncbi:hypothetical protein ACFY9Q_19965 [Streptomyces sp. NPDC012389]|uniref:hypothetical protein n=1 Tax=Streptomyces sp. NPDC012389 TaxID=3364830 RepID=UPI0036E01290